MAIDKKLIDQLLSDYKKPDPAGHHRGNTRNGKSPKTLKGEFGELELETPRDRKATFDPKIVAKGRRVGRDSTTRSSRCTHAG